MTVLVTGGMGYIGSHTCVELLEQGMDVVVVDNLVNSSAEAGRRVKQITGRPLKFYQMDVRDRAGLDRILPSRRSTASFISRASRPWVSRYICRWSITTTT